MKTLSSSQPAVFYVSSHGLAGDPWFYWFAKALNAHWDIMIFMGESTRSKYLKERSRKERPDLLAYTQFLIDVGAHYAAVGECYAYRSYQLESLWDIYGDSIRFVNLVRHPYCWLDYYIHWRCQNMNMPSDDNSGIEHEWQVTCHDQIRQYGVKPYSRDEIEIWSAYQGMLILNRMLTDLNPGIQNIRLERLVHERSAYCQTIHYLTHGRISFDTDTLDRVYSWVGLPLRENSIIRDDPEKTYSTWPDWKKEAFARIVKPETKEMFRQHGYSIIER